MVSWWAVWWGPLDGMQGGHWTYPHRRPGRPPLAEEVQRLIVRLVKRTPAGATAHRGRASTAWHARLGNRDPHDAAPPFARPGATADNHDLAGVPAPASRRHRGVRLLHRRHSVAATVVRAVLPRAGHPAGPPDRGHRQPRRHLGRPAGPQPCGGAGRAGPAATVPATRSSPTRSTRWSARGGRPDALAPVQAPNANAYAERWIRTVRAESLDWLLIIGRGHLDLVLRVYVEHYNAPRPHRDSGWSHRSHGSVRPPSQGRSTGCAAMTYLAGYSTNTTDSCLNEFLHLRAKYAQYGHGWPSGICHLPRSAG